MWNELVISKLIGPLRYYAKIWYEEGEIKRIWYGHIQGATKYEGKGRPGADIMSLILQLNEPDTLEIIEI